MIVEESGSHESGFTYLGLIFFVAVMGIALAMAGTLWSFSKQREKERELLFIGEQFRRAIGQYYEHTPGTIKRYPQSLNDLLQDNRYVSVQRYLRRIYRDPITKDTEWGLVQAPTGGVMGVYSKSVSTPIKVGGFRFSDRAFEDAKRYSDWAFVYVPIEQQKTK